MENKLIEEYINDIIGISKSIKEAEEGKSEFVKEVDQETMMNDCDATNCAFYNEYFKANCRLASIEIDARHGCMQFKPKGKGNES